MVQKIRAVKLPGFCPHSAGMAKRTKAAAGFVQLYKPQKIPQFGVFSLDNTPNWCIIINVIKRGTAQEANIMTTEIRAYWENVLENGNISDSFRDMINMMLSLEDK